jgi:hypothetical protein
MLCRRALCLWQSLEGSQSAKDSPQPSPMLAPAVEAAVSVRGRARGQALEPFAGIDNLLGPRHHIASEVAPCRRVAHHIREHGAKALRIKHAATLIEQPGVFLHGCIPQGGCRLAVEIPQHSEPEQVAAVPAPPVLEQLSGGSERRRLIA